MLGKDDLKNKKNMFLLSNMQYYSLKERYEMKQSIYPSIYLQYI